MVWCLYLLKRAWERKTKKNSTVLRCFCSSPFIYWYGYFWKLWFFLAIGLNGQCDLLYLFPTVVQKALFLLCWKYRKNKYDLHRSCNKRKTLVLPNQNLKLHSIWDWRAPLNISNNRVIWSSLLRAMTSQVWGRMFHNFAGLPVSWGLFCSKFK